MRVIRALVAGRGVVTDDRCEVGILRTPTWSSLGTEVERDPRDRW